MNFYIADMHLGHKNVLKFDNRPFLSVSEMDKVLIENWNSRVSTLTMMCIFWEMYVIALSISQLGI